MRRTLTATCIFSLSAMLGCSSPMVRHVGGTGVDAGTGVGGVGGLGGTDDGGTGGTGGTGGGSGMPDGGTNCGVQNFMLTKSGTPDVLLVQDRSGSMGMDASGGNSTPSKWTSVTTGLNQVVSTVTSVNWGLLFFEPANAGIFAGCTVPSTPDVACGPNTASAITAAIGKTSPSGGTPTNEAIDSAVTYFKGTNDGNSHYILLATDGLPQCDTSDDSAAAEASVTAAVAAGIKVIVVGIGNDPAGDATLTTMANNGGMPNKTAGQSAYYQVNNATDLETDLKNIAGTIVSCDYALGSVPANPDLVTIQDNKGVTIPKDPTHMNGWDFGPGDMSIQFYGAACTNLQMGVTTSIAAVYGCPPIQ